MTIRELIASPEWRAFREILSDQLSSYYYELGEAKTHEDVLRLQGSIYAIRRILSIPLGVDGHRGDVEREKKIARQIEQIVVNGTTTAAKGVIEHA